MRHQATTASTSAAAPSNTASTRPSRRFLTHPDSPRPTASARVDTGIYALTSPETSTRTRFAVIGPRPAGAPAALALRAVVLPRPEILTLDRGPAAPAWSPCDRRPSTRRRTPRLPVEVHVGPVLQRGAAEPDRVLYDPRSARGAGPPDDSVSDIRSQRSPSRTALVRIDVAESRDELGPSAAA